MVLPVDNPTKSYWIEAAESSLRDFHSTDELPQETDVTIIGSGYAGSTTAYWLSKFTKSSAVNPRILLLEARDICGGATGRNGGQLRPHAYSRYPAWSSRFGPDGALALIKHEMAHLPAFKELLREEGISEHVCFKLGETFDAAMSDEAWVRLKGAYEAMITDHGEDGEVIRDCRLIEDCVAAEEFTQMKGCVGAVVHPTGQIWPYKFVHALLQILLETGTLNLQSHTTVMIETSRGIVRTKSVVHATNRWASHLLPEFSNLIYPIRGTLAAVKAPEAFLKHTGAQHWDSVVNNYHVQLPPPHNAIVIGGAKQLLVHNPRTYILDDHEDKQFDNVPEFFQSWGPSDVIAWPGNDYAELAREVDNGGCWTGVDGSSIDGFPFVGPVPNRDGHFVIAGFTGHGMPRILLSASQLVPSILSSLGLEYTVPKLAVPYPPLPEAFVITAERVDVLQKVDAKAKYEASIQVALESSRKPFCNNTRCHPKVPEM